MTTLIDEWLHNLEWSNQREAQDFCSSPTDMSKHVVERGKETVFGDIPEGLPLYFFSVKESLNFP